MREVVLFWDRGLRFIGEPGSGHAIVLDGKREHGGFESAPQPMELLLLALGGCTGMDVTAILRKMRQEPRDFVVRVKGERADKHPKIYTKIHITYEFWGKGLDPAKLAKAIVLSQDRYCSVSAHLRATSELTFSMIIHGEETTEYSEEETRALVPG